MADYKETKKTLSVIRREIQKARGHSLNARQSVYRMVELLKSLYIFELPYNDAFPLSNYLTGCSLQSEDDLKKIMAYIRKTAKEKETLLPKPYERMFKEKTLSDIRREIQKARNHSLNAIQCDGRIIELMDSLSILQSYYQTRKVLKYYKYINARTPCDENELNDIMKIISKEARKQEND